MIAFKSGEHAAMQLHAVLLEKAEEIYGSDSEVKNLVALSGGASRETWSFDVLKPDGTLTPLILKRDPMNYQSDGSFVTDTEEQLVFSVPRATEGKLMDLAAQAGVPVPQVPFYLEQDERTSAGFIMTRLEGEVLGRRILREDIYADARAKLAFQCGHAAARMHSIPVEDLPQLESMNVREEIDYYRDQLSSIGHPYPSFELGFRWLEERVELAGNRHTFAHGDFRVGNIVVGSEGLRGVLDFEMGHLGNPTSDLGWICARAWRYGHIHKPVGGFGEIKELLAGYAAGGGGHVEVETLRYWEVFSTLRWGILSILLTFSHINGSSPSVERAVIGRRSAETEYDLLQLID